MVWRLEQLLVDLHVCTGLCVGLVEDGFLVGVGLVAAFGASLARTLLSGESTVCDRTLRTIIVECTATHTLGDQALHQILTVLHLFDAFHGRCGVELGVLDGQLHWVDVRVQWLILLNFVDGVLLGAAVGAEAVGLRGHLRRLIPRLILVLLWIVCFVADLVLLLFEHVIS